MNKYNIFIITGTAMNPDYVFANYFEEHDGSFYFYTNEPEGLNSNTLVAVYPVNRTIISVISYDINKK
jgi:hypothetical protein